MKTVFNLARLASITLLLAACTIGNGWICGPQTPAAYCDREAYEKLLYPKGVGEYWEKPDAPAKSATWQQDWVACGGSRNGSYGISGPPASAAEDRAASERKFEALGQCMKAKGYHFTGTWRTF